MSGDRLARLQALGQTFRVRYVDGQWPDPVPRYAVSVWSERYEESFMEEHDSLEDVRNAIKEEDVDGVWDLDTGQPVRFSVTVTFEGEVARLDSGAAEGDA